MLRLTPLILLSLFASGCATPAADRLPVQEPMAEASASLFPGDAEVLTDEQIQLILRAETALPESVRVALIHLQHQSTARFWGYGPYWVALLPGTRQELATALSDSLVESSRVGHAAALPSFLLPEKPSVAHLREASARFRADAVLVYTSDCQAYEQFRFFRSNRAKAFCNVESALLDVRTGIVPLTAQVLHEFTVDKTTSDANMTEMVRRAETSALRSALTEIGSEVAGHLTAAARP